MIGALGGYSPCAGMDTAKTPSAKKRTFIWDMDPQNGSSVDGSGSKLLDHKMDLLNTKYAEFNFKNLQSLWYP